MVTVRCPGARSSASPVSCGTFHGPPPTTPPGAASAPNVIRSAATVHRVEQVAQRVAVVGDDVEGDEVQPVLGGRGDAGLPLAAEGHDAVVGTASGSAPDGADGGRRARGVGQPGGRTGEGRARPGGEDRPAGWSSFTPLGHHPGHLGDRLGERVERRR